jgi:non-canonical (house-cleaning) NTP pyrophosphatase
MLFALGTTNIPTTQALQVALENCPYMTDQEVDIRGFKVDSGVPDMPLTLEDLRIGAKHRAQEVRRLCSEADFFVGME